MSTRHSASSSTPNLSTGSSKGKLSYISPSGLFESPDTAAASNSLIALKKFVRGYAFAPLPFALSPSCAPSNTVIALSQHAFFQQPVLLDIGDKERVMEWYNGQASTTIDKIQLRKDRQQPYYHEYILIFLHSGCVYRIDRRPDRDTPIDTVMNQGCKAYDMIAEVGATSLKRMESVSVCRSTALARRENH